MIAKAQSAYLSELKEKLPSNQEIILLDFTENHSFIAQDSVQGYHWNNSQATLHPFVAYCRDEEDQKLKVINYCVLSDCLKHNASTVHSFQYVVLQNLKERLPNLNCCIYFSDGAPNQYKYLKNIANLNYHYTDYELKVAWHFFATSHGKSPCDGTGGSVKCLIARTSLQNTRILNINEMYKWSAGHTNGVKCFKVTENEVESHINTFDLENRYSKTYTAIPSHYSLIPKDGATEMHRVSADEYYTEIHLDNKSFQYDDIDVFKPGMYAVCAYDNKWYIGNILEVSK